jgi:acyl-coenzyme A synthetase/AMP-(fatty) acid ligase
VLKVELTNHVKSKLQPYKYPRWVEFVDDLPKTVTARFKDSDCELTKTEDHSDRRILDDPAKE